VADGLFSGYGQDTANALKLMDRSECLYLHRSIETWLSPPNFAQIEKNISQMERRNYIFGMFLAEAINTKAQYYYADEKRNFDFAAMCHNSKDSLDYWGKDTCKPDFRSAEYRKYLDYITRQAMDIGVQTFLFGQIYFQDWKISDDSYAKQIVKSIRKYAESKNSLAVIGAQTNNIEDEAYLKIFDYIEGGIGIHPDGNYESGPCFSKWWKKDGDRCWALLWNNKFAKKANNVIVALDWSGFVDDDMSIFAQMDQDTRVETLRSLYGYMSKRNVGFLMPFLAVINKDVKACHGPSREFYSPDNLYECKDEDAINDIFGVTKKKKYDSQFISQVVPNQMAAGQEYLVFLTFKNNGKESWNQEGNFQLVGLNLPGNLTWAKPVDLADGEIIKPGEDKTFSFKITAPAAPGEYDFQWQMSQADNERFGNSSDNLKLTVTP